MSSSIGNPRLGRYSVKQFDGETVRVFVASPLPPSPAVRLGGLQSLIEEANQAIGRLDGLASVLPDPLPSSWPEPAEVDCQPEISRGYEDGVISQARGVLQRCQGVFPFHMDSRRVSHRNLRRN